MTVGLMHLPTFGLLAAVAAFVTDQAAKAWALSALWPPYSPGMEVLPVLNLRLGFNTGVTFGMFRDSAAGAAWVLVAVGLLVVGILLSWLWRTRSGTEALGLGLVIGGALGNILDRVRQGGVTDFLDAHYGGWHWPTFNMADVGIVCGVGLLLRSALRPTASKVAGHATRRDMDAALTGDPDRDFLASLVAHARGAIELARVALRQARTPEILSLAEAVIRSREEELRDWEALLARIPSR